MALAQMPGNPNIGQVVNLEFLLKMNTKDIFSFCSTRKDFAKFCKDNETLIFDHLLSRTDAWAKNSTTLYKALYSLRKLLKVPEFQKAVSSGNDNIMNIYKYLIYQNKITDLKLMSYLFGESINTTRDLQGNTCFMYAFSKQPYRPEQPIRRIKEQSLIALLEMKPDINEANAEGVTLIMKALDNPGECTEKVLLKMLDMKPNLDLQDKYGNTAPMLAFGMGYYSNGSMTERLYNKMLCLKPNLLLTRKNGRSAIGDAITCSEVSDDILFRILKNYEIDYNQEYFRDKRNNEDIKWPIAMSIFANYDDPRILSEVLKKGVDIGKESDDGDCILSLAYFKKHYCLAESQPYRADAVITELFTNPNQKYSQQDIYGKAARYALQYFNDDGNMGESWDELKGRVLSSLINQNPDPIFNEADKKKIKNIYLPKLDPDDFTDPALPELQSTILRLCAPGAPQGGRQRVRKLVNQKKKVTRTKLKKTKY